jgi:hypothetical protein
MATVNDLITGSLRLLGVLASGENPTASESQDAFAALNDLLDTWNTERLMVYSILPSPVNLVAQQKSYTLGTGGDWNIPRPVGIDGTYLQYTDANSGPPPLNLLVVALDLDQYNAIIVPNTTTTIPTALYIDEGFPLRTAYLWPIPQVDYSMNLFTWTLLEQFAAITDDVAFPPGYARMLRFNLALELAPEYGLTPSQVVAAGALDSKAAVKRNNITPLLMACDPAVTRRTTAWNWLTGST